MMLTVTLENIWQYALVFIATFLVDVIPFIGPPAWTVMVFFRAHFDIDEWMLLFVGVSGSAAGRYTLSQYIPILSLRILKKDKNKDLEFIGNKLNDNGIGMQLFIFLYTLMPLPSTPLFTAAGIGKVRTMHILPSFFAGKFISDMIMVFSAGYLMTQNEQFYQNLFTTKNLPGFLVGVVLVLVFLFIDWRKLIQEKKVYINLGIWR